MARSTQPEISLPWRRRGESDSTQALHLVVAWSLDEPERVGEAGAVEERRVFGRGEKQADDPAPRLGFFRMRPGENVATKPLEGPRISRVQLELCPLDDERLEVKNVGRGALLVDGEACESAVARPGSTLTLKNSVVLLVTQRPTVLEPLRAFGYEEFAFGRADSNGIVGESPGAWGLRDSLAFAARAGHHVLLHGESGVGKELAARAVHAMSDRAELPLVARNASTLPEGLVDAELFGTARNYPNAGMPERAGLIGEADTSTLFLDEIGELAHALQAHLLRVLDRGGEYQRLGETRALCSDFRLLAATNRELDALKHDLLARLPVRVELPGLNERRDDIPLIVRHLLATAARKTPELAQTFFEKRDGGVPEARVDPSLLDLLVRHQYTHHVRELDRLLWIAFSTSRGNFIAATDAVCAEVRLPSEEPRDLDQGALQEALSAAGGNVTDAARRLGLKNRFVLYRLMKRFGIAAAPQKDRAGET